MKYQEPLYFLETLCHGLKWRDLKAIIIHTDRTYLVNAQSDAMAGLHHYRLHHFVFQNHQVFVGLHSVVLLICTLLELSSITMLNQ